MARTIVVTSGKGGVGKSIITTIIGKNLAKIGKKVVLIDADLGLKNLDVIMNIESRVVYDLDDLMKGRCPLSKALVQDKEYRSLFLLPASMKTDVSKYKDEFLLTILNELDKEFDFIIIDCPAGIEKGFHIALKGAKEALVVATLDKTSIRDADKVIGILKSEDFMNIKLIINKIPRFNKNDDQLNIEDASRILQIPILGVIYEDNGVKSEDFNKLSLLNTQNIAQIIFRLTGEKIAINKQNLFKRILKKVGLS